ncbi:6-bladed beta-propeller [Noviherbaspirillum denitrificans]|uniref:6-bladed beta-propeller n=1 Tax=Noviherbaspirillum denitrificans TaxID=1968433 RepID=A0A254T6W2_9BURK|nr:6-bladed beta-propeller [Noviherbaspirillum denitrificans]OWW18384.1 hypothetical protein AYR66_01945 [Noviherbaspirillum denitrificans]
MNRLRNLTLALLAVALLLSGCAETKHVMRLDPEPRGDSSPLVWPSPPEIPRFRYVGQLMGEQNFVPEDGDTRNMAITLLHWVVGLFGSTEDKTVLKRPQSGMVDTEGRIFVTDVASHAIYVFDKTAGKLDVWTQAQENSSFVTPIGIAEGAAGQILVADAELGRVFLLDREGKPLGSFGKDVLMRPTGLVRDAQHGRIYVADTHAHNIKVFDDEGRLISTFGQQGEEEGSLNFPTHLAFANGNLYVSDGMNARVQIFDVKGKTISSVGRRGRYIGNLSRPKGVTVDPSGKIYVVESFNDSLLVFDGRGNFLMPIGGTGKEIGEFYLPSGVWCDRQGRIYVADMFNGRVVIFQLIEGA